MNQILRKVLAITFCFTSALSIDANFEVWSNADTIHFSENAMSKFDSAVVDESLNSIVSKIHDTIIRIQTYDQLNQVVHPDILYRNKMFYLGITPYPNSDGTHENPSVYYSYDGLNFTDKNIKNPLANKPPYDHNDDPDLSYNKSDSSFYLIYQQTMRPDSANLIFLKSKNFYDWSEVAKIHYNLKKENLCLSPALIKQNDHYYLYSVLTKSPKNKIQYFKSKSLLSWDKEVNYPEIQFPDSINPWHLDIISLNNEYLMICDAYSGLMTDNRFYLMFFSSSDLIHWNSEFLFDKKLIPTKDCAKLYRSTGIVTNKYFVLWYSYEDINGKWKMGVKKFKFPNTVPEPDKIKINSNNPSIEVYPNPVHNNLYLKNTDEYKFYEITDEIGHNVRKGKILTGTNQIVVDHLRNGFYSVSFYNKKKIKTIRFIKV